MQGSVELIPQPQKGDGTAWWAVLSIILHVGLLALFLVARKPSTAASSNPEMLRYVELMRQTPFTEAPGAPTERQPSLSAPYSDANRIASTPRPQGERPTPAPGSGGLYQPGGGPRDDSGPALSQGPQGVERASEPLSPLTGDANSQNPGPSALQVGREKTAHQPVDWNRAIASAGQMASAGSGNGIAASGGEDGFAESGPISFESQWYDWGPYSQSMVAKIRTHWYANMPAIIRSGLQGLVVIRFTIQRSGEITDITILQTSTVPPFDYAARKAIELASPLAALPADFPSPNERVTAAFYYNMSVPARK